MISVNNLTINFGGRFLFDNISFLVNYNDKIGLIGRNGTGKSTLMKIMSGKEEQSAGNIIFPKTYKIEYLPQELNVESNNTVIDEVYSALDEIVNYENRIEELNDEISNRTDYKSQEYTILLEELAHINERLKILGSHSIQAEIEKILIGLGFKKEEFDKLYNEFSGGWQMRIELAKILLKKPNCILLDEPTNHLDIESIRWLEKFLKSYSDAVIIISHDRTFLDSVTNRTIEIVNGKIYDMPFRYSDYILAREEQKEQELNAFKNQQKQIAQTEKFIERFRFKATLSSRVQSRIKALERIDRIEIEDEDGRSVRIRFPEPPRSARIVVEAKNLSKSYGDNLVLKNIDFVLERGEKVCFVGRNGEGKSTLSKIIANIEEFRGELNIGNGVDIGYFAQQQTSHLNPNQSIFEIIDAAAVGEMRPQVRTLLGAFLFSGDDIYKKVKVLSGGEKSRLSLAKLMLKSSNLLILDEPTNHLDMLAKDVLKQALLNFSGTLIVVSHDREFLDGLTQKTFEFKNNKITEFIGDIEYYLDKSEINSLQDLELKEISIKDDSKPTEKTGKIEREKQKEIQRELNKQKKLVEKIESEITLIEENITQLEIEFQDPELFMNVELSQQKNNKFKQLKLELEKMMNNWEIESNKLEKMNKNE